MDVYKAITAAVANIVKHTVDKPDEVSRGGRHGALLLLLLYRFA
jgi:hypothetical protein